jgi:hypothetical protein
MATENSKDQAQGSPNPARCAAGAEQDHLIPPNLTRREFVAKSAGGASLLAAREVSKLPALTQTEGVLENELIRIEVAPRTGDIVGLYNKRSGGNLSWVELTPRPSGLTSPPEPRDRIQLYCWKERRRNCGRSAGEAQRKLAAKTAQVGSNCIQQRKRG